MSTLALEMLTYGDVVKFVIKNKGKNAFLDMSNNQIEEDIYLTMNSGQFLYESNGSELTGYLQYGINHDTKTMFVYQNIALSLDRLYRFFQEFLKSYPSYKLQAMRHGKLVTYNNNKLLTKLQYYGQWPTR